MQKKKNHNDVKRLESDLEKSTVNMPLSKAFKLLLAQQNIWSDQICCTDFEV